MYRLLFDDGSTIESHNLKSLAIGLAKYDGTNPPRYMYLWFKHRFHDKSEFKKWENQFFYHKLLKIYVYDETEQSVTMLIPAPDNFLELVYEEDDLVVAYGDPIYANEAY